MTMSHAATVGAEAHAVPKSKSRNVALDRTRTFLTLVVLLHHAVIPYTHFGHTDPTSWIGFDVIVLATDSFFMAMFFFCQACSPGPASPARRHRSSCVTGCCASACPSRSRHSP